MNEYAVERLLKALQSLMNEIQLFREAYVANNFPNSYEPKTEPQTCSFSDCDNFKNPDYERCIECKRKQIKLKTEQTEREDE